MEIKNQNNGLKISIITPSFNSGDYIERAIKSVIQQDYKSWEHIIMDGGSTDLTLEIFKKYNHLKWTSKPDNGQADAMNKGFELSVGDIIVYLNADDYFLPGAFSSVIPEFEKGAKFVVGNVFVKSTRLQTEFLNIPRITLGGMLRHWEPNAFCYNPVGYFYKREVQVKCPFNVENYSTIDLEFLLDAATRFTFTKVNYTLGCFEDGIKTKTGIMHSKLDHWQPSTYPYIDEHLISFSKEDRKIYEQDRRREYALMQAHMNRINKDAFKNISAEALPLISFIIPTYNCGRYLKRAIESILSQGLNKLEIIVVDDKSTDDTQSILQKYYGNNPSVRIICNIENKNLSFSRNIGLDIARGKYIFFLDADDWIEPETIMHLASIAEEYEAEIVACGINKVWENGRKKVYHSHAFSCKGGREALNHLIDYRIGSIVWNKLYLREFIEDKSLRFDEHLYSHGDIFFTIQAVYLCKKYISITNLYCNYLQRSDSIVHSRLKLDNLISCIKLPLDIIEFLEYNDVCKHQEGELISQKLLKAHCSNIIFPELVYYAKTRSKEELANECWEACHNVFGIKGYALATFLIRAMVESQVKRKEKIIFSFKGYLEGVIPRRFWQTIRKIYDAIRFKKIKE